MTWEVKFKTIWRNRNRRCKINLFAFNQADLGACTVFGKYLNSSCIPRDIRISVRLCTAQRVAQILWHWASSLPCKKWLNMDKMVMMLSCTGALSELSPSSSDQPSPLLFVIWTYHTTAYNHMAAMRIRVSSTTLFQVACSYRHCCGTGHLRIRTFHPDQGRGRPREGNV